jgi:hypothetical protein
MNYIDNILENLKLIGYYRFITHSTYIFNIENNVTIFHLTIALFGYIINKNDWEYLFDSSINLKINSYDAYNGIYHEINYTYLLKDLKAAGEFVDNLQEYLKDMNIPHEEMEINSIYVTIIYNKDRIIN